MSGALQYKLEVYCGVSLSPKHRSQQGTALQMRGVLWYKLEVYCQYLSDKLCRLGVPEQFPNKAHKIKKIVGTPAGCPWDTRGDKQGSTGWCPRNFLLFTIEILTEKGPFGLDTGGVFQGHPAVQRVFRNFMCSFGSRPICCQHFG